MESLKKEIVKLPPRQWEVLKDIANTNFGELVSLTKLAKEIKISSRNENFNKIINRLIEAGAMKLIKEEGRSKLHEINYNSVYDEIEKTRNFQKIYVLLKKMRFNILKPLKY